MGTSFRHGIVLYIYLGVILTSCNQNTEFDSKEWKRSGGARSSLDIRYNMVENLISGKVLIGKSKAEVHELIGLPSNIRKKDTTDYKYYLVQAKYGWSDIDPEELIYLEVKYNDNGMSESVRLYSTR